MNIVLPTTLDGRARRAAEPSSELTAAWGDPAVVLRCGVPRPPALKLTSELFDANGVAWFAEQTPTSWRFTTTGRTVYLELTVPGSKTAASAPLVDLAPLVTQVLPKTGLGP